MKRHRNARQRAVGAIELSRDSQRQRAGWPYAGQELVCDVCGEASRDTRVSWMTTTNQDGRILQVCSTACWALLNELPRRPRTRADCRSVPRPCPYVGCRYHLYLEVMERTGRPDNAAPLKFNFPDLEPGELEESCVLDVCETGSRPFERVARLLNISREDARKRLLRAEMRMQLGLMTIAAQWRREDDEDSEESQWEVTERQTAVTASACGGLPTSGEI